MSDNVVVLLMNCCRQTAYKKHIEYLFWVIDPELTSGQYDLLQTLEEGFMSAGTYCVIALIVCDRFVGRVAQQ